MRRETLADTPPPEDRAVVGQVLRRAFPLGLRSFEGLPDMRFDGRKHKPHTASGTAGRRRGPRSGRRIKTG